MINLAKNNLKFQYSFYWKSFTLNGRFGVELKKELDKALKGSEIKFSTTHDKTNQFFAGRCYQRLVKFISVEELVRGLTSNDLEKMDINWFFYNKYRKVTIDENTNVLYIFKKDVEIREGVKLSMYIKIAFRGNTMFVESIHPSEM